MANTRGKKSFIFGCSDLGQLLYANLMEIGTTKVEAFVTHRRYILSSQIMGLPVIAFEDIENHFSPEEYGCYICVGYSGMNQFRCEIFAQLANKKYEILEFQHPDALVRTQKRGIGNLFFNNVFVDFFTELGSGNIFYPGSSLSHHSCAGDFNFFAVCCCVAGHVRMRDGNFIGANSTIGNNISIGNHCLVGAGAYLPHKLYDWQVFVPCRGKTLQDKRSTDFI